MTEEKPRSRARTSAGGTPRTKQSMAAACDINAIMRKHLATGHVDHINNAQGVYGDFSNVDDYHAALNRVKAAQASFDALPSKIRNHCRNDPGDLVDMAQNPDRVGEMRELGLLPDVPKHPIPPKPEPKATPDLVQGGD